MAAPEQWAERITEWRQSGLSAKKFSTERNFNHETLLTCWRRFRREERKSQRIPFARVVRVPLPSASHKSIVVEIGGARVLVSTGVDEATLKTVFTALRSLGSLL